MKVTKFTLGVLDNNVYVCEIQNNAIVIDPTFDITNTVENYLTNNNLQLQAILLTHGHFDHSGGANALNKRFGAPIHCVEEDLLLCINAQNNVFNVQCESCQPTQTLAEGKLTIGEFDITVLSTAGHTQGSVCFIMENYLFSGDTLFCESIGRTDFPESNNELMQKSLKKLNNIEKDYILLSGHGEDSTLQQEKQLNYYLKNYGN